MDKLELEGENGDMTTKHLSFMVEKCVNGPHNNNHCASPKEIEDFIWDTSI